MFKSITRMSADRFGALVFAVVLSAYGIRAWHFEKALEADVIGPSFFPICLATFGLVLSIILFLKTSEDSSQKVLQPTTSETEDKLEAQSIRDRIDDLVPLFLVFCYVILLFPVGFLISTFIYVALTLKLLRQPTWAGAATIAAGLTILTFVVFKLILDIPLPTGTLLEGILGDTYGR